MKESSEKVQIHADAVLSQVYVINTSKNKWIWYVLSSEAGECRNLRKNEKN